MIGWEEEQSRSFDRLGRKTDQIIGKVEMR